ncbi:MAG TPA: enoyl-CoA hydratase-related protein [Streptosporangiaceae bacterium]|jgi:2-(1,2-epoxy-1,2-dihydrophenyl)acetyl-CoA isomerase
MPDVLTEKLPSGVMIVTLNRPDALNTLGGTLLADFGAAMGDAERDPAVRAVLITGAGRAFCAGADLSGQRGQNGAAPAPLAFSRRVTSMQDLHGNLAGAAFRCDKPTVALVNGAAAGAGFGVALSCDFRIASERALFVSAFARIGLSGDNGITWGLSRLVGRSMALEILMLSPRLTAAQALELGLVRSVVPPEDLLTAGLEFGERLAAGPTQAFAIMKRNLEYADIATYQQSLDREAFSIAVNGVTGENADAIQAFLDKREPDFRH